MLLTYSLSVFADHPSVGLTTGGATPITTTSAETLSKSFWSVGFQYEYIDNNSISEGRLLANAEANEDSDVHSVSTIRQYSFNIAIGITDDFTFAVQLPYVKRTNIKEAHHDAGDTEIEELGDSEGVGDAKIFGQYRFFNNESKQDSAAIILGVKVPTGETNEKNQEGKFEAEHQPGSGSWDPFLGFAYSKHWNNWSLDNNVTYQLVNEGTQDTDLGDFIGANTALSYRMNTEHAHQHHHEHLDFQWDLVVELNGEWRAKENSSGDTNQDSGGFITFLSPGVRVSSKGFSGALSIGIPVIENLHGLQSEPQYRVIANVSIAL
jgi:hypothetical protein